jgi:coenzyme F420 hydrogenase subunit beta
VFLGKLSMAQGAGNAPCSRSFLRIESEVIDAGLCTHCGTCVGLSGGTLQMRSGPSGPLPVAMPGVQVRLDSIAYDACPGKGINYPAAYHDVFGAYPQNWLIGPYRRVFVGNSRVPEIRRRGASGGIITQTLVYLLENGQIDGAVVLRQGWPKPWQAGPIIAQTAGEIMAASQSVYVPTPVNTILAEMEVFDGRLAYVGLPDQVASLRQLQKLGHRGALNVDYVVGPYVGTSMYFGAVVSYLRSNGVRDLNDVTELSYREGEWPGYLQVQTRSGAMLRIKKFYYNYLIPFYITQSSLLAVDFTNELTDISVGDAWHPRYEKRGGGFSVVVARSEKGEGLLTAMRQEGFLALEEIALEEALSMHAHMLDFKKRGTFIRLGWLKVRGKRVPDYGYQPTSIPLSRKLVELIIVSILGICRTRFSRRLVEWIPVGVIGPLFDVLRRAWKKVSKPVKRKGLGDIPFEISHGV